MGLSISSARHEDTPKELLVKAMNAMLRIGVMLVFGTIHFFLLRAMRHLIPQNMPSGRLLLEDISFVFFFLVYVYLLWDMVCVFIPAFQISGNPSPGVKDDAK